MIHSIHNRGFTLVETLVALTILSVAIIPAFALSTSSVDIAFSIRNNVTAANLAQEGIEVVRAIRDDNWLNDRQWDDGLLANCAVGCRVEWDSRVLLPLDDNPPLSIDAANGLYIYGGVGADTVPTIFRRKVSVNIVSAVQLRVDSEVTWVERGRNKSIKVESYLLDWK